VEEGTLTSHISVLRKALGEGADSARYIETIPKRGYSFVAPITMIEDAMPQLPVKQPVRRQEPALVGRWAKTSAVAAIAIVTVLSLGYFPAKRLLERPSGKHLSLSCLSRILPAMQPRTSSVTD
jgi:hypothetical protein